MATSKIAVTKMASFLYLAPRQHFVPIGIILDSPLGIQFESNVLVIGGFQMCMDWQLCDWYTDEWHINKLTF